MDLQNDFDSDQNDSLDVELPMNCRLSALLDSNILLEMVGKI